MRMTWLRCGAPLACALLAIACGRSDSRSDTIRAKDDNQAGRPQVTLSGCVQAAPGTNQYVLNNVRLADREQAAAGTAPAAGITEGSWVKLRAGDDNDQLRGHVGRMVSVTGTLTDSGVNTIGTTGESRNPDEPGPRTDESRAARREHHSTKVAKESGPIGQQSMANGTAAEIAVHSVTPVEGSCPTIGKGKG